MKVNPVLRTAGRTFLLVYSFILSRVGVTTCGVRSVNRLYFALSAIHYSMHLFFFVSCVFTSPLVTASNGTITISLCSRNVLASQPQLTPQQPQLSQGD
jgi:hypothetical protein